MVFTIENVGDADLSEDRRIDETVTRTATIMHLYGTIMAVSNIWRRKALLALMKTFHKRNLNAGLWLFILERSTDSYTLYHSRYFKENLQRSC